jgi:glycosyltransferase involved in cell wall biosynthesis
MREKLYSSSSISIIIPSIGRPSLSSLLKAIHLDKSLKKHEIIIVINSQILKQVVDKYKKYQCVRFIAQDISSISKSRNKGITAAKFNIISLIDDDDLWVNGRTKIFYEALLIKPNSIVFGSAIFISNNNKSRKILGSNQQIILSNFLKQFNPKLFAREKYFLQAGNCAFRKNKKIPKFNEKTAYMEDQIWVLDLLLNGFSVQQITDITLKYFFSRERSNERWNIDTEKVLHEKLSHISPNLANKYIYKKSLKSLSLSTKKYLFKEAKKEIIKNFNPRLRDKIAILIFSLANTIIKIFKN